LFWNERDTNITTVGALELDKFINYKHLKMSVFHVLRKQVPEKIPIKENKDLNKYIKATFEYQTVDWNKPAG
jgi:hypothetical protein